MIRALIRLNRFRLLLAFESQLFHLFDWFSLQIFSGNAFSVADNKQPVIHILDWYCLEVILYLPLTSVNQSPVNLFMLPYVSDRKDWMSQ